MTTESSQEKLIDKSVTNTSWKDRVPTALNFRRSSAPDGELQTQDDNPSVASGLTGTTLYSEPLPGKLVHSSSMPLPGLDKPAGYSLSIAGIRIQTTKANLSSGFPYTNALYELKIAPNSWSEFSDEIVKATKLSVAQKSLIIGASVGVGLGTGILSSSYLSVLGVAPAMIAGKVIYDNQVTRKVKQGLKSTEEGSLNSILRRWNEEVFISRGFFVVLEVPEEAKKKEKIRDAKEKAEAKAKERELKLHEDEDKEKEKSIMKEAQKLLKEQKKAEKKRQKKNGQIEVLGIGPGDKEETQKEVQTSENEEGFISEPEPDVSTTTRGLQDTPNSRSKDDQKKKKKTKKFKSRFQVVLLPVSSLPIGDMSQLYFIQAYVPAPTGFGERESYYNSQEHIEFYPVEATKDPVPLLDSTPCQTPSLTCESPVEAKGRVVSEIYTSPTQIFYGNDDNSQSTFFPTPRMSTVTLSPLNLDTDTAVGTITETVEPVELPTPEEMVITSVEKEKKKWTDMFSRKK